MKTKGKMMPLAHKNTPTDFKWSVNSQGQAISPVVPQSFLRTGKNGALYWHSRPIVFKKK